MLQRRHWFAGLPVALALTWAAHAWFTPEDGQAPQAPVPVFTDWSFNPYAAGEPLAGVQHNADAAHAADAARAQVQRVLDHGSLRGTQLDGDWGRWVDGQLQPSRSLRQRFDYLLTALGEADPAQLRHWIEQEVTAQMSAGAARQVLAVWDRYIALQQHRFELQPKVTDPVSWEAALSERRQVRQQVLGLDWAQAFYAEEDATFKQYIQQRTGTTAAAAAAEAATLLVAAPGVDPQQLHAQRARELGPDIADRLQAEDDAWAAWERRLQTARQQLQAIAAAPELSVLQRGQAQEAYLKQTFSGNELVRARALLPTVAP